VAARAAAGVLGEGGADLDDDRPRSVLQRFDLRKREVKELAAHRVVPVSGDGTRLVLRDHDGLRVVPSARKQDEPPQMSSSSMSPGPVPGRSVALWNMPTPRPAGTCAGFLGP